jgi:hypothetical protein
MNSKHKRLKSSQQFERMGDVMAILRRSREEIVERAERGTRWETRRNALETLRRICKSVMLCDEQLIRHELMKDGVVLAEFMGDMIVLAQGMTESEKERYDEAASLEKLVELREHCDWEVHIPGLEVLLNVFGVRQKTIAAKANPAKKTRGQVVITLDGDSDEDELEEDDHDAALKAFDRSRGCICYDRSIIPGICPIHKV